MMFARCWDLGLDLGLGGGDASALRGMVAQWVCCFFLSVDECISGKGEKEAQKLGESQYLSAASIPNTGAAGKRGKPRPFAARGGGTFGSVFCWPCLGMQPPALQGSRCLAAFLLPCAVDVSVLMCAGCVSLPIPRPDAPGQDSTRLCAVPAGLCLGPLEKWAVPKLTSSMSAGVSTGKSQAFSAARWQHSAEHDL